MKIFLVISIIALWWVPMNLPGNVGISKNQPVINELIVEFPEIRKEINKNPTELNPTKRKMNHLGKRTRKNYL